MLDAVLDEIVTALKREGIGAFRVFPEAREDLSADSAVSVGIDEYKVLGSGMGDYLGVKAAAGGGADLELYGKKLELTLGMEVFAPFGGKNGAAGCDKMADKLRDALVNLPEGVRTLEMNCGEIETDEVLSAYRCRCQAKCVAMLIAESDDGKPAFTDFKLKGTVKNGN